MDMLYSWRGREKERTAAVETAIGGRSEGELAAEIEELRKQLRQARQDVEILQEVLGFLARAGGRRLQRQAWLLPGPSGPLAGVGHVPGAGGEPAGVLPRYPAGGTGLEGPPAPEADLCVSAGGRRE